MLKEFAPLNELHDEVDPVGFLEHIIHADDEWMVHLVQNESLDLERLDRFVLYYYILSDHLHREILILQLVTNKINFAESTSTNNAD